MKISILQINPVWEDKTANFINISRMMRDLYASTDLIILPEMFSTGFSMNTSLAEEYNGTTFKWMREQAEHGKFAVCGSFIVREDNKYHNRFVFVSPEEVWFYNKRHLFSMGNEDKFFTPGNSRLIFNYKGFRICPFICYDLRFPVWSRNRSEYDLAIYSSSWPAARANVWSTLLKARAIENQCYVAGANRTGTDGNNILHNGKSQIIDAKGEIILSAGEKEEVFSAELSLAELNLFRKKFNTLKDSDDFILNT
ncbi:MAG TPA: amidohydrolase [Bacteroidales bacterium]|nr:amidohydrolase [Bacteroidales bacterium]